MAETGQLIELLRQQLDTQRKQMETLVEILAVKLTSEPTSKPPAVAIPSFVPFDSFSDYWARFLTFLGANSVPDGNAAQIFLTNQCHVKSFE